MKIMIWIWSSFSYYTYSSSFSNKYIKEVIPFYSSQIIIFSLRTIDSTIYNCIRDCHTKYFHTFGQICVYDICLENITNNEIINLTISGESMNLYELD